jgi:hypothetical protein
MLLWDIPRSDFVSVDFWMSSAATDTTYFMSQFEPYATALGPLIQFTPRYAVSKMKTSEIYRTSSCFKGGENYYCDSQMSSLGDRVVQEDLRQLCIWHSTIVSETNGKTGKTVNHSPLYWQYISIYNEKCHPSRIGDFTSECSDKIIQKLGIDSEKVGWCVLNLKPPQCRDGGYAKVRPECSVNLLEDQAAHQAWSPHALRINGWRYSGPLEASVVLKTICQGFSSVPDICNDVHVLRGADFRSISVGMAWLLVVCMLAIIAVAFWLYRRNLTRTMKSLLREEVMLEVRSQMADYAMLAEDEENLSRGGKSLEMTRFTPQQHRATHARE